MPTKLWSGSTRPCPALPPNPSRPANKKATMRIAIGQLWQESNTSNPLPTTQQDFEHFGVLHGGDLVAQMAETNELGGFIQSLRNWPERPEIVGLARLAAWPSGPATIDTFEWLKNEL